jgi:hypothetical protein
MTRDTFVNFFYRSYQVLLTCYYTQVSYTDSWEALVCYLQSRARIHTILVIGLYELLGNPTT